MPRSWRVLDGRIVAGEVDAVHLVAGYVAVGRLDLGTHRLQNVTDFWRLPAIGRRFDFGSWDFRSMTNLGTAPLRSTDASMQTERLQDGLAEAVPVIGKMPLR